MENLPDNLVKLRRMMFEFVNDSDIDPNDGAMKVLTFNIFSSLYQGPRATTPEEVAKYILNELSSDPLLTQLFRQSVIQNRIPKILVTESYGDHTGDGSPPYAPGVLGHGGHVSQNRLIEYVHQPPIPNFVFMDKIPLLDHLNNMMADWISAEIFFGVTQIRMKKEIRKIFYQYGNVDHTTIYQPIDQMTLRYRTHRRC